MTTIYFPTYLSRRQTRKRKKKIEKKPLVKGGRSKKTWFSNLRFPQANINRYTCHRTKASFLSQSSSLLQDQKNHYSISL